MPGTEINYYKTKLIRSHARPTREMMLVLLVDWIMFIFLQQSVPINHQSLLISVLTLRNDFTHSSTNAYFFSFLILSSFVSRKAHGFGQLLENWWTWTQLLGIIINQIILKRERIVYIYGIQNTDGMILTAPLQQTFLKVTYPINRSARPNSNQVSTKSEYNIRLPDLVWHKTHHV